MPFRTPRALVGALLIGLVAGACAGGSGSTSGPSRTPGPTSAGQSPSTAPDPSVMPGSSTAAVDLDQAFIDMMVPHHQAAIEMAKIAQGRAPHPELKTLANEIISAQEGEIKQLRDWRQAWFGSSATPPMDKMPPLPGMTMPGMEGMAMGETMDMTADIEPLRTAEPFDMAFIEAMSVHHQSAIAAAQTITKSTQRPEIKQIAAGIIAAQQRELDQMKAWMAAWYPG